MRYDCDQIDTIKDSLSFMFVKEKYIYIKWNNKNKRKGNWNIAKQNEKETENIATKLTYVQSYSKSYKWVAYIEMHQ